MTRTKLAACLLLGAVAGAGCALDDTSPTTDQAVAAIEGGRNATQGEFPTVVALSLDNGQFLCTGTLIAPDLVLTAAHCVDPVEMGLPNQAQVTATTTVIFDDLNVYSGPGGRQIAAANTMMNPGYGGPPDADLGLVWLATPVTDRVPSPVNLLAARAPAGVTLTMVGFGVANNGSAGVLNVLDAEVTEPCPGFMGASDSVFLCHNEQDNTGICSGDSGGPAYAMLDGKLTIVGVTSYGYGPQNDPCGQEGAHMRTDAGRAFLTQNFPAIACQADGACEPTCGQNGLPADPDCPTCTTDDDCGTDEVCGADGRCEPAPLTPGGLGSECGDGLTACEVGVCASGPDGQRCSQSCTPGAADACPDGFDCLGASGSDGACWPQPGGCCSTGTHPEGAFALTGVVALALAARRRRRS